MYTPLYVKTEYSLLSSLIKIDDLLSFCVKNGFTSLGICDDQMFGVREFYLKCIQHQIKPIIGFEAKLEEGIILLYAKNYQGYQELLKLSTIQSERRLTFEDLNEHMTYLLAILPFASSMLLEEVEKIYETVFLGYETKEEEKIVRKKTEQIVYLPRILFLDAKDADYLSYLYLIRDGKTVSDHVSFDDAGKFFPVAVDPNLSHEGIYHSKEIANLCQVDFPPRKLLLPIYPCENGMNSSQYLRNLSMKGLMKRFQGSVGENYQKRLFYELDIIEKMGFSNYFLVVYDFIKYAKKNGILVGPGRGSAGGSLVAYSLGITDIDPIRYQLLFERFLNPSRISMPDIDTDFPDQYRDQVIRYVTEKYGKKNVAGIITFGTLGCKQVIRDVGRVLNIPVYKVDALCKYIPAITKEKLPYFYQTVPLFRDKIESDVALQNLYRIAVQLEGLPRHTSVHAAGIVMCQVPLDEVVPLAKSGEFYVSGYSMEYLEDLGLLKMDFLGLKNLTTIMHILEDIQRTTGEVIDFANIPLDDEAAIHLFTVADTSGIFQFESTGMRNFLRRLRPSSFEDIFAAIALFRPGPAVNIETYIKRKHGLEPVTYLDPCLEPILNNTYGILIYQEQIMQVANVLAGYSLGEADILRKAMSKKKLDVLKNEEEKFIRQSIARGHEEKTVKEIFKLILNFAGYGFNRSHSVAYAIIAYKMAYLKAHYPKQFFTSLLSSVIGSVTKTREYILEAKHEKIAILKPDIKLSTASFQATEEGILFPLSNVKGVGSVVSHQIIEARKEGFTDIYDAFSKIYAHNVSKSILETLILAGTFSSFPYNRATLIHNLDALIDYASLTKDLDPSLVMKPEIEIVEEYPSAYLLQQEKEIFGFYLSDHPISNFRLQYPNAVLLNQVGHYLNRKIQLLVLVESIKTIETKKKDRMAFFVGSDETGSLEFTVFPKTFQYYLEMTKGELYQVFGRVERRLDKTQVIVEKLLPLEVVKD